MLNKISLFIILIFCCPGFLFAQEQVNLGDKIIGSTFKNLAKTFIASADINALKQNNINRLESMDEEKFNRHYAEAYEIIKNLPGELKYQYGISGNLSKQEAIELIRSVDKKSLYEMIDAVPDKTIALEFKQYLDQEKVRIQKSNIAQEISKFWNNVVNTASASPKQR